MCEFSLCPRGPPGEDHRGKPCAGHGVCTQTTLDSTPMWHKMRPRDAEMFNATASKLQEELYAKRLADFSAVNSKLDVNRTLEHARDVITDLMDQYAKSPVHKCMCLDGWYSDNCNMKRCPNDCNGHGDCAPGGTCNCAEGYRGEDCSVRTCPGAGDCGGHGQCVNGTCACDAGFSGADCSLQNICHPQDCNGHGACVNGQCECLPSYTGEDCAWSSSCFNFCSGRGRCVDEQCECDPMYMGIDCSEPRCPGDCSGHGDCFHGVCVCEPGYTGEGCAKTQLWPMRCSTRRHGLDSSMSCKRGHVLYNRVPTPGNQIVQVKFNAEGDFQGGITAAPPRPFGT